MIAEGGASASLVVETVFLGTDNGLRSTPAFFLYDEQGITSTTIRTTQMSPVTSPLDGTSSSPAS
jgi:hypothetical protein